VFFQLDYQTNVYYSVTEKDRMSHYRFSCEEVLKLFSVEAVKEHLLAVNQGDNVVEDSLPVYLKRMFELYASKSLNWRCHQM